MFSLMGLSQMILKLSALPKFGDMMLSVKSFMCTRNKMGTSSDPCGYPLNTDSFLIDSDRFLPVFSVTLY